MDPPKSEVPDTSLKNREAERTEEASSSQDSPDMASSSSVTSTEEASSSSGPTGVESEFDKQGRLKNVKRNKFSLPVNEEDQVKELEKVIEKAYAALLQKQGDENTFSETKYGPFSIKVASQFVSIYTCNQPNEFIVEISFPNSQINFEGCAQSIVEYLPDFFRSHQG